jgi:[CysO sulfur-carrier protein]-S-L-cysteine hydrolase
MRVPSRIREELLAHAREDAPNECCGLVGGEAGELTTYYRVRNAEASPLRYMLDPTEQLRATNEMEEKGEELAAIFHSHTGSPAYPSQTDINLALMDRREDGEVVGKVPLFPGAVYLIASLAEGEEPLRGFRIEEDGVSEVELEIV